MKKIKITAILLAALTACAIPTAVQANYQQENKIIAESLNDDSAELVTESLSNYSLGYMSWGVKHMGLDKLQKKFENSGKKLPEVRVAVMDTGIKKSNRYLQGRYTDDGYNFVDNNTNVDDDQYHGTEVSGIIADATTSNVKILPIKVMDKNGDGKMADTAKGIYYALDHGADVINLSLSGDDKNHTYHSLDDAIAEAISRNVIVVVAAGNQDTDASLRYPANKDNVITITAVNKSNKLGLLANYGSVIDFALPGMSILAPHKSIMMLDSGTSMALTRLRLPPCSKPGTSPSIRKRSGRFSRSMPSTSATKALTTPTAGVWSIWAISISTVRLFPVLSAETRTATVPLTLRT